MNFPLFEISGEKLQCLLCPHHCKLKDNQRGQCFVRRRDGNTITLDAYGHCIGLAIDPVEKKPLYHFLPGSNILSFGTAGCNLSCKFCQNWEMSTAQSILHRSTKAPPAEIVDLAKQYACPSVAFTYNDPVIFFEYACDTADICHAQNIKTVAVTAGFMNPKPAEHFFAKMDAANIDLKSFSDDFYKKLCGARLAPVLESIQIAKSAGTWVELTTLLIPNANDSDAEISALSEWVVSTLGAEVPLHFSAFHPAHKWTNTGGTALSTLLHARKIALQSGLKNVYTGNVHHPESAASYCENCHAVLIERNGYRTQFQALKSNGSCKECGHTWSGVL